MNRPASAAAPLSPASKASGKAARKSARAHSAAERARQEHTREFVTALFRGYELGDAEDEATKVPSSDAAAAALMQNKSVAQVVGPCFIIHYPRYVRAKRLLKWITHEVTAGAYPTGALRFLAQWIRTYYVRRLRKSREFRAALCALVSTRRGDWPRRMEPSAFEAFLAELQRLKLTIVRALRDTELARPSRRDAEARAPLLTVEPHILDEASSVLLSLASPKAARSKSNAEQRAPLESAAALVPPLASSKPPPPPLSLNSDNSVALFMASNAMEIARYMLHINYRAFSQIELSEFYNNAWNNAHAAPNLHRFTTRLQRISEWVATVVLVQRNFDMQRKVVTRFLQLANFACEEGDVASCYAIMQAFELNAVNRLRKKWRLPPEMLALGNKYALLISDKGNYKALRDLLAKMRSKGRVCVPHMGIYQRDLFMSTESNPDYTADNRVNVNRIVLLGSKLCELDHFQGVVPRDHAEFFSSKTTRRELTSMLMALPTRSPEVLEELSCKHKPRVDAASSSTNVSGEESSWSAEASSTASTPHSNPAINDESSSTQSEDYVDV